MFRSRSPLLQRHALVSVVFMLFLLVSLLPPSGQSAVAQTTSLPDNVLQASVRLQLALEVTPAARGDDPFFCEYPQGGVLEYGNGSGTIISEDGHILTNHHVTAAVHERIPDDYVEFCSEQPVAGVAMLNSSSWPGPRTTVAYPPMPIASKSSRNPR